MPLDGNGHENGKDSFKMICGSEYNPSLPLSFHSPQLQQLCSPSSGRLNLNIRVERLEDEPRKSNDRVHSNLALFHTSLHTA